MVARPDGETSMRMTRVLKLAFPVVTVLVLATGCGGPGRPAEHYGPLGITGSGWMILILAGLVLVTEMVRSIAHAIVKSKRPPPAPYPPKPIQYTYEYKRPGPPERGDERP